MEKIIQSLLLENESVELPGLGVFKKRFRSSHIDADDTIHPPTSKPVFSVDKTVRGKDLVGAIAVANNLSTEDAGIRLKEYISGINESLEEKGSYSFEGLGTLLKFSSGKIDFAPSKGSNFFLETLGFAAIRLPKQVIDINTQAKAENQRQPEIHEKAVDNLSETTVHDKVVGATKEPVTPPVTSKVTPVQPEPPKKEVAPIKTQPIAESKPIEEKAPPVEKATPVVEKIEKAKENKLVKPKETPVVKEKPVVEAKAAPAKKVIEEPAKKRGLLRMLLPLLLLILAAWALFQFFGGTDETSNQELNAAAESSAAVEESNTVAVEEKDTPPATETVEEKVVSEEPSKEKETVVKKPVEQKPVAKKQAAAPISSGDLKKGYYIIVGAFGRSANADKVISKLNKRGYEGAKIVRGGLNQVGAYATKDMGAAKSLQSELKDLGYHDAWIMKR